MAALNITTNMNRTQFIAALTGWDAATKITGSDYVWACTDDINVSAEVNISAMTLSFAVSKNIKAIAGGIITVSVPYIDTYIQPATLYLVGVSRAKAEFVTGTGKWLGKGLVVHMSTGDISFNSTTSQTDLKDITLEAEISGNNYIFIDMTSGKINMMRVSGFGVSLANGDFSMNPKGIGLVSGNGFVASKFVADNKTLNNFVVQSSAGKQFNTSSTTFGVTTLNFKDGYVNPLFMGVYPKGNSSVIRKIQRTITFQPKSVGGTNISGFNYRISSNRVVEPASTTTPNTQIVTENNKAYGYNYVMTVWNGNNGAGSDTYGVATNQVIDKDMRVQYRKHRYFEDIDNYNTYYYSQTAQGIMRVDTYVKESNADTISGWIHSGFTKAHQFYDLVRYLVAYNFPIPDDLLTTDGETLTIKDTWKLERSTLYDSSYITSNTKTITIGQTSSINKDDTGIWKYNAISGLVDTSMTGHTDLKFARTDGKANLVMKITCPAGSKDPVVAIWPFSQGLDNRANLITGQATGTGTQNITLVVDATVKYYCIAKALGANLYRPFSIDPVGGLGGNVPITLFVYEKADGNPLFPDTLTPAQTAVADTLDFHGTHIDVKIPTDFASNARWSATDKIWQYKVDDFIAIAYKLDVIQTALTLTVARNQLIFIREGMLLISAAADDKILEQDPANKTTVSSTTNVKVSFTTISIGRIGDTDARNTFIDDVNGTIDVRGGVPINGGFPLGAETKINETYQRLALDSAKPLTSKPDGGITSIGITITATELGDGSVVQTRGT